MNHVGFPMTSYIHCSYIYPSCSVTNFTRHQLHSCRRDVVFPSSQVTMGVIPGSAIAEGTDRGST